MYATALTVYCLDHEFEVVDPSPVVAERVDGAFETGVPDVAIQDASDRLGIEISGTPADVETVADVLADCSIDTFRWSASLPRNGAFVGDVTRTEGSGAIVRTGAGSGFLPFGSVDGYIDEGDHLRVSVADPSPPWRSSRRPILTPEIQITGSYVTLVRGAHATIVDAPSEAIAQTVDRLDPDIPENWGIVIHRTASAIAPSTLNAELGHLAGQSEQVDASLDENATDEPAPIVVPYATVYCRFGREARFELDDYRATATHTVEGHHRIKASGNEAGTAVDFLERLAIDGIAFDADAVLDTLGPETGDQVRIEHGKPSGVGIDLGRAEVIDRNDEGAVTVSRTLSGGGRLDGVDVPKEENDTAETTFVEGRWWYPTVYRSADGAYKGTYVNVGTPIEIYPDRVSYVDLFIDVIKDRKGSVDVVDREELWGAVDEGLLSRALADRAESVADAVARAF